MREHYLTLGLTGISKKEKIKVIIVLVIKVILVRLPYTPWRLDLRPLQAVALGKGPKRAGQQNLTLRVEDAEVVVESKYTT